MSDYIPDRGGPFDPIRDRNRYDEITDDTDRKGSVGIYAFLGVLVAAVVAAGFLFFGSPAGDRTNIAQNPEVMSLPAVRSPAKPVPTAPSATAAPGAPTEPTAPRQ